MKKDSGWNLREARDQLRARIDPYLWDQGQELYRRGAVEDVEQLMNGSIQVKVLDPRDSRRFFVTIEKTRDGRIIARCPCPYRLHGFCRHQVVSLEYLLSIAEPGAAEAPPAPSPAAPEAPRRSSPAAPRSPIPDAVSAPAPATPPPASGPLLFRLFGEGAGVTTRPDGSLLRLVLHSLGSISAPHKVGLQLFTGTGWTDVRSGDIDRWISRGAIGPHARDSFLAACLAGDGSVRREVGSDLFAALLAALAGTDALVDRMGTALTVSLEPRRLHARLARGKSGGVALELSCRAGEGVSDGLDEVSIIPSVAPWIQLASGAFHPLAAGAPGSALAALAEEDLSDLTGPALDRLLSEGVPLVERLSSGRVEVEPGLIEEVEGVTAARVRLDGSPLTLEGKLELRYGDEWVEAPASPEPWVLEREGKIQRFPPAGRSLARAARELEAVGFTRDGLSWKLSGPRALAAALAPRPGAFVTLVLPASLETLDLVGRAPALRLEVVEAPGSGPGRGAPSQGGGEGPAGAGAAGARKGSGIPWLEVGFRLVDGDRELPVRLADLEKAAAGPGAALQLEDGTVLGLEHDSVRSLLEIAAASKAAGAGAQEGGRLRLPLPWIGELAEDIPGREVEFQGSILELAERLRSGREVTSPALEARLEPILREYQKEAVAWLGRLSAWGLGGILADEMGLGKTVMALAHFFGRPAEEGSGGSPADPVLVVCPSSLIFNWVDEARRFFPGISAVGLHRLPPAEREEAVKKGADLLVTSYALLRRDREALEARGLRAVVLDEAQHIKNAASQTARAAFALRAPEKWALSGTPIENHLGELWSIFNFLLPGFLGKEPEFRESYADPIARGDDEAVSRLRARVRPFLLRRTKAQVLSELPPRIEQVERVPMTDPQARVYEAYLRRAREEVEGSDGAAARFRLLAALTRLRQVCCHPRLVLEEPEWRELAASGAEASGGKFELLGEILDECVEEGHRVLVYSQFTSMLDLIEERLEERGTPRCRLDGSTRDREGVVKRFVRDPAIPVFLISLKAGGFGLNLTQADTVILYDPWWNPAAEDQAAARAHRMGQTLPVHVHKLITSGTVEEKIVDLQGRKRDLADRIVRSEEEALATLSLDELRSVLFEGASP